MYIGAMAFGVSFGMKAFEISSSNFANGTDLLFIALLSLAWISGVVRSAFYKEKYEKKDGE